MTSPAHCPGDGVPICRQRSASIDSYGGDGRRAGRGAGRLHGQAGRRQTAARTERPGEPVEFGRRPTGRRGLVGSGRRRQAVRRQGDRPADLPRQPHTDLLRQRAGAATKPAVLWRFPKSGSLCSPSTDEKGTRIWCGTGWTGQPAVFERDGRTWVVVRRLRPRRPLPRRRDRRAHPARLPDRRHHQGLGHRRPRRLPARLLRLARQLLPRHRHRPRQADRAVEAVGHAVSPTMWNDDWDGAGLVIDDYLFEGGENSQFHIVKLNRGYDADGKVTVDAEAGVPRPGLGRRAAQATSATASVDRELGRHLTATPSTSPTPAAWCRAGTSAV